jgi:hypothetical protein
MPRQFEVRWKGDLAGPPAQVRDACTVHTAGWYWKIRYQPWAGGAETGLTEAGGTVTRWEPALRFTTRAEGDGGFFNQLDYELEPSGSGTHLDFTHRGVFAAADYDRLLNACQRHTEFYYHSLTEYMRYFGGRDAVYVAVGAPGESVHGGFAALRLALGVPGQVTVGSDVTLRPAGIDPLRGVVDYAADPFLGIRTPDALYRFFGRDTWGMPIGMAMHLYADGIDQLAVRQAWDQFLNSIYTSEAVR